MIFELDDEQVHKYNEWSETHECSIRHPKYGRQGGTFGDCDTFTFTPTGIGTIIWVKCACGAKIDLTGEL